MIDKELLDILCCPETKEDVFLANDDLVNKLNSLISENKLTNRNGDKVTEKICGGLIRNDKKYLYPIREDIPIMLIEEAFPLETVIDSAKDISGFIKKI
ncbi:MAG TPA: hypothetical protein PKY81_13160 [bacterium]|nr:hypothetical protein [bacterium]HPN31896.1 hypothetical protein [bacterium]